MSDYVGKSFDVDGLLNFVKTLPYSVYDFELRTSDIAKKGTWFDTSTRPFTIADGYRQTIFNNANNYIIDKNGCIQYNYHWDKKKEKPLLPTKVVFNEKKGATTLLYGKDNATVVKTTKGDKFDRKFGFLLAYFQHNCGMSKTQANKYLNEVINQDD